jgi:hypothetical protein
MSMVYNRYEAKVELGSVLLYGQAIRIRINPVLSEAPLYLHSQPVSPLCASKISHQQQVCFRETKSYDTVWYVNLNLTIPRQTLIQCISNFSHLIINRVYRI